tara:strand:- start:887 stop:1429 length:543 start_codon:yes stop_codon:yes gene_type:complete
MNLIHKVSSAYSKKSCNNLIEWFENNIDKANPGGVGYNKLSNREICLEVKTQNDYFNLGQTLVSSIESFKSAYPPINKYIGKWVINNFVQLVKYDPNHYYSDIHCENDGHPKFLKRVFAWMIFLNDIKEGGGTKFLFQDFIAEPKAGDFYIWSAAWTHLHQGINAPKETKYIVTGWCDYV